VVTAEPARLAQLDQLTAAARDEAVKLAKFYRTLRKRGIGKRLAHELTIGYQEFLYSDDDGETL
jgi:hypothetical protein